MSGSQPILGVDAGGTKTDALVIDRHGAVLAFVRGGGANHEAIGWARAQEQLRRTVVQALEMAAVTPESIAASGWGLAGLDWPSDEIRHRSIIADLGFPDPALVVNDAFLALTARPDDEPGVAVVSGTGVVVVGRSAIGTTTRTLGVGAGRGDWGSGGQIAFAAAKAIAAQHMGLGPETALTELALQRSGVTSVDAYCQQVWRQGRTYLLPPDVWQVAASGDAVAAGIADRVADSLAAGAGVVARRLDLQRAERHPHRPGPRPRPPTAARQIGDGPSRRTAALPAETIGRPTGRRCDPGRGPLAGLGSGRTTGRPLADADTGGVRLIEET